MVLPANRHPVPLQVVLFSGGRGSGALTRQLGANPSVALTIAVNGYDDGASTGEVRRFLGDSLGPSDFRKNASTLASTLRTCSPALVELLDLRLPAPCAAGFADALVRVVRKLDPPAADGFPASIASLSAALDEATREHVGARLDRFVKTVASSGRQFEFADCSLGNLVFAGGFLRCSRHFNAAVDDYCSLLGLSSGQIENVTDGTNAFLIALDVSCRLLASEHEIVDTARPTQIRELFLVDRPLTNAERTTVESGGPAAQVLLAERRARVGLNPRLAAKIGSADLIIYAPGTQHSSLFPSYMTPGLPDAIAANLNAIKVLVTNIQPDAEITGSNAVDLLERAVYYLKEKGRASIPTPFLITHSLLNDPTRAEVAAPYVPLGPTEAIEDPRLVRIADYEDGVTGRHDAARVLEPFIRSITTRATRKRVAVLLHDGASIEKVAQTMLEMVRGGIGGVPVDVTVFYAVGTPLPPYLAARLPFATRHLPEGEKQFAEAAGSGGFDYVLLFESSGMYRGEETVPLLSQLAVGPFDAVWGSRRLSVRDIEESYRFRYRKNAILGVVSYVGSHVLSLMCLALYGRYVTDTLSGVRAIRAADALAPAIDLTARNANHTLLAHLLRRKAEILEMPVRFVPLSPERVKRTGVADGLRALVTLVARRFSRPLAHQVYPAPATEGMPAFEPDAAASSSSASHVQ